MVSMYSGTDGKVNVFSFRTDNNKWEKGNQALPNKINNATKHIGVCEKHWPTGLEIIPNERQ